MTCYSINALYSQSCITQLFVNWFVPQRTEETLGELLKEIQQNAASVRFDAMANIIAVHCQSEGEMG